MSHSVPFAPGTDCRPRNLPKGESGLGLKDSPSRRPESPRVIDTGGQVNGGNLP
jgi:hypothetical protein